MLEGSWQRVAQRSSSKLSLSHAVRTGTVERHIEQSRRKDHVAVIVEKRTYYQIMFWQQKV